MHVMSHLSVAASSSRLSLRATRCYDGSIMGFLRFWVSSGALGDLLIVLRCKVLSPLGLAAELCVSEVNVRNSNKSEHHYQAPQRRDEWYASHTYGSMGRAQGVPPSESFSSGYIEGPSIEARVACRLDWLVASSAGAD
jgi:hypothetical protein